MTLSRSLVLEKTRQMSEFKRVEGLVPIVDQALHKEAV